MYDNIYLVNWNLYFFQKKNHYEFLDEVKKHFKYVDFPDDINNQKLIKFINRSNYKTYILPFQIVGKKFYELYAFYHEILDKLLNMDLKENKFYFFTNDPFLLAEDDFGKKFNKVLNVLYKNKKRKNIKIINPLFSFKKTRFSQMYYNDCGTIPFSKKYDNVIFFPYIHYCYKLAKMSLNNKPINKIFLTGGVCGCYNWPCSCQFKTSYPDRLKFRILTKKYPQYLKEYEIDRIEQVKSDENLYNQELSKYKASFLSGVYGTDSNFILLKLYEILGSGSLLLLEKKCVKLCKKLGLIENEHFISINLNDYIPGQRTIRDQKILKKIKFILDDKNEDYILKIRKQGMEFCHKNLDYKFTLNKFLSFVKDKI